MRLPSLVTRSGLTRCRLRWSVPGPQLLVDRSPAGELELTWGKSCASSDVDYHLYEGTLGDFFSHNALLCTTGGLTELVFTPASGNFYYLIAPTDGTEEGSYGRSSDEAERPPGLAACLPQSPGAGCAR